MLITAGILLISNPENEELPIVLDVNNINSIVYFSTNEKVLEAGKDDIQINQFAELFNKSNRYSDDAGTTHSELVNVIMNDGSKIEIWWGTQGFITVGDEKAKFNVQNSELEDFLSELISASEKTAMKGLALYVWINPEITEIGRAHV